MPTVRRISSAELAAHKTLASCWILVHGKVYDVTGFLADHPGGKAILVKAAAAGGDAGKQFDAFHARDVLSNQAQEFYIGEYDDGREVASIERTEDMATEEELSAPGVFGDLGPFFDPAWYQDEISPAYYKDSHRLLRARLREFTDRELMPFVHQWDEAKLVPKEIFLRCAELNLQSALMPLSVSGYVRHTKDKKIAGAVPMDEWDAFHELIFVDELSRTASAGAYGAIFGGLSIAAPPILQFGSEDLKQRLLPQLLSGEKVICLCITEPRAGSDVANLCTEATPTPDGMGFIVNGEKKWITNGAFADYFTVAVRTGGAGMSGISMLVIERTMPGVKTRSMACSGGWGSGTSYVTFEDVYVPRENLIGRENKGWNYVVHNFNHERITLNYQINRFGRELLAEAIKYAHKRRTFGQRLIDHQVIRHKLADMARDVEATHAWTEQLVARSMNMSHEEAMLKLGGAIALLKVQGTRVLERCAREASQIFGGLAYTRGGQGDKVERLYREVRAYAIMGGSEEIMTELGIKQAIKVAQISGAKL